MYFLWCIYTQWFLTNHDGYKDGVLSLTTSNIFLQTYGRNRFLSENVKHYGVKWEKQRCVLGKHVFIKFQHNSVLMFKKVAENAFC